MWRVLAFLALICLAAYGAVWLANSPEVISATWAGKRYSVSLAVGVTGLVALALLVAFVLALINGIIRLPVTLARGARGHRHRRGLDALSRGIVAVGAGGAAAARRYAGEAGGLLGHPPLAPLLNAQAAQASGDRAKAETTFREMTGKRETKVLGLRGLYLEARRRGDAASAREYAEEAAKAAPSVGWANEAVLEALSAEGNWQGAVRVIERRTSLGLVDRATSRRQRAVLLAAEALDKEATNPDGALATAEHAARLAPGLVPAAVLAGQYLSRRGDLKKAAKILEAAWTANPHPDIAGAYLNLRPGDSAVDRMRRAETLAKLSSWSDEARLAVARAAVEARDFARARETLAPVLDAEKRPTVRICMMMAEIEGRSGQAGAAREWLARAARAPRDKAWIADGYVSDRWLPVSPVTGKLDAFVWETPPELLGDGTGPDITAFEPDAEETEAPLVPGRAIAPPAPAKTDPAPKPPAKPEPVAAPAPAEIRAEPAAAATPAEPSPPPAPAPASAALKDEPAAAKAPPAPASSPARPEGSNGAGEQARTGAEPEPVAFPVPRAPDDAGSEGEADRRKRFRVHV
ncbi:heme biosynthesis HemY N-terminal domain-containing protein [Enterovirga sp.]|uniref:heme biosynthesis protein HemY n=1 Tax=Enterovirga sp. TaxID=2026350 RepID=UPI002B9F1987|nr:heme biosynthesis HemY N-terminal domain-containing protein [Enterovirga sp.]HMO29698.1 heme biosynthesis HemY N-terminal domain-containing protein [Enterovirga sp.]